jgi:hypothetical protein
MLTIHRRGRYLHPTVLRRIYSFCRSHRILGRTSSYLVHASSIALKGCPGLSGWFVEALDLVTVVTLVHPRADSGAEFVFDDVNHAAFKHADLCNVDSESTVIPRLFPILPILGFRSSAHPNDGDAVDEPHRPRPRPVGQ